MPINDPKKSRWVRTVVGGLELIGVDASLISALNLPLTAGFLETEKMLTQGSQSYLARRCLSNIVAEKRFSAHLSLK